MLPLSDGLHPRRFPIGALVTLTLLYAGRIVPQSTPRRSALAPP